MRLAFIINRTRVSPRFLSWLWRAFAGMDAEFHITGAAGDGIQLARKAAEADRDMIVAVGGDGTVNEVANGLCGSPATLGIIPCGTANDFASALGVPRHPQAAAGVLVRGRVICTGLGLANGRYFVSGGGLGLAATALACADRIRSSPGGRKLGTVGYVLGLLQALVTSGVRETRLDLEHEGSRFKAPANLMLFGHVPTLGKRFCVFPGANPRDGCLSLCRFSFGGRGGPLMRALAAALRGHHLEHDGVTLTSLTECTLSAEEPMHFFADGEFWPPARQIHLKLLPGALSVCVPRAGLARMRAEPRAQKESAVPACAETAPGFR